MQGQQAKWQIWLQLHSFIDSWSDNRQRLSLFYNMYLSKFVKNNESSLQILSRVKTHNLHYVNQSPTSVFHRISFDAMEINWEYGDGTKTGQARCVLKTVLKMLIVFFDWNWDTDLCKSLKLMSNSVVFYKKWESGNKE